MLIIKRLLLLPVVIWLSINILSWKISKCWLLLELLLEISLTITILHLLHLLLLLLDFWLNSSILNWLIMIYWLLFLDNWLKIAVCHLLIRKLRNWKWSIKLRNLAITHRYLSLKRIKFLYILLLVQLIWIKLYLFLIIVKLWKLLLLFLLLL